MCGKRNLPQRFVHPWLVVTATRGDMLLEHSYHTTGSREAFLAKLEELRDQGWIIEDEAKGEPKYNSMFCHRGNVRIHVHLSAYDPAGPIPLGHGGEGVTKAADVKGDILIKCQRCGHQVQMTHGAWMKMGGPKVANRLRCVKCEYRCAIVTELKPQRSQDRVVPLRRS